jgi:hypothetical protein
MIRAFGLYIEWVAKNGSAQFLAVGWIVHVQFKVHRLRHGFSVSNALLLEQSLPAFIGHNLDKIGEGSRSCPTMPGGNSRPFGLWVSCLRKCGTDNKHRTAGLNHRCGSLTLTTPCGVPGLIAALAAFGVFGWFQVFDFDVFLSFFLFHFILLSRWVWPSVNSRLENSFLAVH